MEGWREWQPWMKEKKRKRSERSVRGWFDHRTVSRATTTTTTDLSWLPPPKEALWASRRHMGGMHALLGHLPPISAALPLLSPAQVAEEWMKERIHPWVGGWVAGGVHSSRSSFLLPPALLNIFGRRVIIMCPPQSPPPPPSFFSSSAFSSSPPSISKFISSWSLSLWLS